MEDSQSAIEHARNLQKKKRNVFTLKRNEMRQQELDAVGVDPAEDSAPVPKKGWMDYGKSFFKRGRQQGRCGEKI